MIDSKTLTVELRIAVLWVTGRDLLEPPLPTLPQGMYWRISEPPKPRWEMTLSADKYLKFGVPTGPNVLHRLAQRLVLGIRWRMLPKTPDVKLGGGTSSAKT